MLTSSQELARVRGAAGEDDAPGSIETLRIEGGNADAVLARARDLWESVLHGFDAGLDYSNPEWSRRVPAWFVEACSPELSDEEHDRWLAHWRSLDRAGKLKAEAERGWSMMNWLACVDRDHRAWWWWAADAQAARLDVLVDGWPAPLASAEWMLRAAGADAVRHES